MTKVTEKLFEDTLYLSTLDIPIILDEDFGDANIVFSFIGKSLSPSNYEAIFIPGHVTGTDFFLESSDRNIYLTNFTFDQTLLGCSIDGISVSNNEIQVFIGDKNLTFYPKQLPDRVKSASFVYEIFGIGRETSEDDERHVSARGKTFVENRALTGGSIELGVHTYNGTSAISSLPRTSAEDTRNPSIESINCSSIIQASAIRKIKPSALDTKLTRQIMIQSYKGKVDNLINGEKVKKEEIVIAIEKLSLAKEYDISDDTVRRMSEEFNGGTLPDIDPITVVLRNDKYHVVSGNRKASAHIATMQKKVYVSKIDSSDESKFVIQNYFYCKSNKENDVVFLITLIGLLFEKLQLSRQTISTWTVHETNTVFGKICAPLSTLRFLVDVCASKQLEESIMKLARNGSQLSNHFLRDTTRKFRSNPKGVLQILDGQYGSIGEMKKNISKVQPDLSHLLEIKKIAHDTALELAEVYKDDSAFAQFVSCSDLRFVKKNTQKTDVISRFENYKKMERKRSMESGSITTGTVQDQYDILITSNEETAANVLAENNDILVIVLGRQESVEPSHVLMVSDNVGVEDESGCLHTHLSMEFCAISNGEKISGRQITDLLALHDVRNRTVFNSSQLCKLSESLKTVYADIEGVVTIDLISELCSTTSTIIVQTQNQKQKLDNLRRKSSR